MANLNLMDEESLGEAVRNYPVIYDKQMRDHKDRNVVNNAWKEIVNLSSMLRYARSHFCPQLSQIILSTTTYFVYQQKKRDLHALKLSAPYRKWE